MNPVAETAFVLGVGLGALFFVSLFALIARVIFRRATGARRLSSGQLILTYAVGGLAAAILASLGYADGGPIRWGLGFAATTPPTLLAMFVVFQAASEPHG